MKMVTHPHVQDLELTRVLQALGDPVRLQLVRMLSAEKDLPCSALYMGRPKSSMSHHFKLMIDAGILRVDVLGNTHLNNLRSDDLEARFPGLLEAIVKVAENSPPSAARLPLKRSKQPKKNPAGSQNSLA